MEIWRDMAIPWDFFGWNMLMNRWNQDFLQQVYGVNLFDKPPYIMLSQDVSTFVGVIP